MRPAGRQGAPLTTHSFLFTVLPALVILLTSASPAGASITVAGKPRKSPPFDLLSSFRHQYLHGDGSAHSHSLPGGTHTAAPPRVIHGSTRPSSLRRRLDGQSGDSAPHSHGKISQPAGVAFATIAASSGGNHHKQKGWARNRFKGMITATKRRPVPDKLNKGWAAQVKAKQGKAEGRKAAEESQFQSSPAHGMTWDESEMERQAEGREMMEGDGSPGVSKRVGPILYRGGGVMLKPIDVHLIFYGDWPIPKEMDIIKAALLSLSDGQYDYYVSGCCNSVVHIGRLWWQ